jgi:ribosomal protein L37AE/L43A
MPDPIKEKLIAKTLGMKPKDGQTIDEVEQEVHNMSVVEKAQETARKLANTDGLTDQLKSERERSDRLEKQKNQETERAHTAEIESVRTDLGGRIDKLAESMKSGASQANIANQIADIKKAATELGMGSSKISEIKEVLNLVETLNPRKNLAEQVKEAKTLIDTLQPKEDKKEGLTMDGVPAHIAIELERMRNDTQIQLERMADDRQRRDQEFKLTLRRFDDDLLTRREKIQMDYQIASERNQLFANGFKMIGRAVGKGYAESLGKGPEVTSEGGVAAGQSVDEKYVISIAANESGTRECPYCKRPVGVGPTTQIAQCIGCNRRFAVQRVSEAPTPAAEEGEE